jgi:hypothetical protein
MAKKRMQVPPMIANPEAGSKLNRAAEAAGVSVQDLADLVFEAGVAPKASKDGITQRYTLQDLGERMWAIMQSKPHDERAQWFKALVPVQQTATITVLREAGFRTEVISRELNISPIEVQRIWNAYSSELGVQVVGIRLDTIAGQLQMAAERAQEMAISSGDHSAFWRIQRELVETYQSIGIVDQAIRRVQVTHRMDDEQKAEIERLIELRNKQSRRQVEILELENKAEQGDDLPDGMTEDYDE